MADKIFLPQWGMGMQEATIIKWLKNEPYVLKLTWFGVKIKRS